MSNALFAGVSAALSDALSVAGQTFYWQNRPYSGILNAEGASIVVAKSAFVGVSYPQVGDSIRITGKDRQVKSVANASMEFVPGGLVETAGPFVDDPNNPALAITFDTFINK